MASGMLEEIYAGAAAGTTISQRGKFKRAQKASVTGAALRDRELSEAGDPQSLFFYTMKKLDEAEKKGAQQGGLPAVGKFAGLQGAKITTTATDLEPPPKEGHEHAHAPAAEGAGGASGRSEASEARGHGVLPEPPIWLRLFRSYLETPLGGNIDHDNATAVEEVVELVEGGAGGEGVELMCTANDEEELREMAESTSSCFVVFLTPGTVYELHSEIIIGTSKTIVGVPISRPILNAEHGNRAFRVRPGVFFDVRHVVIYIGDGDQYVRNQMFRVGGGLFLEPNAHMSAFDVLFTVQPYREVGWRTEEQIILGGDVFVSAGNVAFTACNM